MDPFLDTDDQGDGNDAQLRKSLMISSDKRGGQFNSASSVTCSRKRITLSHLSTQFSLLSLHVERNC